MPRRFSFDSFRVSPTSTVRWRCIATSPEFPRIVIRRPGCELSRTRKKRGPICAAAQGLVAPEFMGVTIGTAGFRPPAAIVETQIRRIADRPFAGTAVQGQGRHEGSVGPLETGQLRQVQR